MSCIIRKNTITDLPQIFVLITELSVFEKVPLRLSNSLDRMMEEHVHFNAFVAVDEHNNIVGYATYNPVYFTWVGKSMYMDDLYVQETHRGQGIGTRLIHAIIDHARQSGCHKLRWQVSEWNQPAITFYESLGAKIDAVEKNCEILF